MKPFETHDEWYFHMRFPEGMKQVTPILTAVPPETTMSRPDGDHSGNPTVRSEVAARTPAARRVGGGAARWRPRLRLQRRATTTRTGRNDDQRKLVLNAILWTAKAEVPANGVESTVTPEMLAANLDPKPPKK